MLREKCVLCCARKFVGAGHSDRQCQIQCWTRKFMKTKAAVAWAAGKPLEIVEVDLEGPRAGEVLVEIKATGVCHTDANTLSGLHSAGLFPSILGHQGAGVVLEVGP